ncbi:MAG: ABC transporter ATP-binding protein [Chloroflexota bacterium]|nr:ABC transporter ATP-binding protein [Chloroflexota bacterium]
MTPLVLLDEAEKSYGDGLRTTALRPTSLSVAKGEFVVILGPSGSGKSTLLNLIGGLDRPTAGKVLVAGSDLAGLSAGELADYRRLEVGFVFQFYNLIPSLTARENVQLAAELSGVQRNVDEVLAAVGIEGRADHFPAQLSGGEQQRVAIARALVKQPPLLLCDEPTGALDYETGKAVLGLLQSLVQDGGRTVLLVTHNTALADMATRLVRLKDGSVVSDAAQANPQPAAALVW